MKEGGKPLYRAWEGVHPFHLEVAFLCLLGEVRPFHLEGAFPCLREGVHPYLQGGWEVPCLHHRVERGELWRQDHQERAYLFRRKEGVKPHGGEGRSCNRLRHLRHRLRSSWLYLYVPQASRKLFRRGT